MLEQLIGTKECFMTELDKQHASARASDLTRNYRYSPRTLDAAHPMTLPSVLLPCSSASDAVLATSGTDRADLAGEAGTTLVHERSGRADVDTDDCENVTSAVFASRLNGTGLPKD